MKPLAEFTKRPTPRQGAPGRKCWVRVIFVGKRDLFASPPTHMRRQRIDDGSDSVFWGRPDAVVVLITSEMGHKQTSCRPRSPAMSADLAFVDKAHFAQENGAFRPHLLPFCYRRLVNRTKRRFHDL